jgi:ribosomal protein L22
MTSYSFNQNRQDVVLAKLTDINASMKDLRAVCNAIRYKSTEEAEQILDGVISLDMPILFKQNNKYLGSRHELGGQKGRWPKKCATIVKKLLKNALAAAKGRGLTSDLYVVHAAANRTLIARRTPSKGLLVFGAGRYGMGSTRFSNLEFAKLEIGLASECGSLSERIRKETGKSAKSPIKKAKVATTKKKPPAVEFIPAAEPMVEPATAKAEPATQQKTSTAIVSEGGKVV